MEGGIRFGGGLMMMGVVVEEEEAVRQSVGSSRSSRPVRTTES